MFKRNPVIFLILLFSCIQLFSAKGDIYEPEKLAAELDNDVLIYIPDTGIDVGTTSIQINKYLSVIIKSRTQSKFTIVKFSSVTINEAFKTDGSKLAYNVQNYNLKEIKLKKINNKIKKKGIALDDILNSVNETDFDVTSDGSQNPPDPAQFAKLRNVFVYNFIIEDNSKKQYPLQIYVEYFTEAAKL
jgi:hypothetical protein